MATKKQIAVTADLVSRATWPLSELGCDYVVLIRGLNHVISNVDKRYALTIIRDSLEMQDKLRDAELEYICDDIADRMQWNRDKSGDDTK